MTLSLVMASIGENEGAVGGSEEAVMAEASQDELFQFQFFSDNRFGGFQARVGKPADVEKEWREQRRKRKSQATGSVDIDTFSRMSMDDKLLVLFDKLLVVEDKQSNLNRVMSPIHEKVENLVHSVNTHSRKLKMLGYRSLDLEARSRRYDLIFRSLADCNSENCTELIISFLLARCS